MNSSISSEELSIDTSLETPPKDSLADTIESIHLVDSGVSQSYSLEISISQTPLSNTLSDSAGTVRSGSWTESAWVDVPRKRQRLDETVEAEEWDISSLDSGEYSMVMESNAPKEVINKSVYSSVYGAFIQDDFVEDSLIKKEGGIDIQPFLGFTTGNNKKIEIDEKAIQKSRELLGIDVSSNSEDLMEDLISELGETDPEIPDIESLPDLSFPSPQVHDPVSATRSTQINVRIKEDTTRIKEDTTQIKEDATRIKQEYNPFRHKVGHPSTAASFKSYLQQFQFIDIFDYQHFKYACLHLQHINKDLSVSNISEEIKRRKTAEYSVLRRIFEQSDLPTVHCVLKVLERNDTEWLIFDGFFDTHLLVDKETEKDIVENRIRGCFNIQVSGMRLATERTSNFASFTLKADYNCLFVTTKSVGFQKEKGVIKPFKDIKYTGLISGLEFKVLKIISRKVTLKCGDFKQTFVDEPDTAEKLKLKEKFLKTIKKYQKTEEVQFIPFVNLLIQDSEGNTAVMTWFKCPELIKGQRVRMVNVKVGKMIGLSFVTCFLTEADLCVSNR